jgi:hypothetical protein
MSVKILSLRQLVSVHIDEVARALSLLSGPDGTEEKAREAVLAYYSTLPRGVVDAVLNEEPIYVAGHLLGLDGRQVDALPETTWQAYSEIKSEFSAWLQLGGQPLPIPEMAMFEELEGYVLRNMEQNPGPNV